MNGKESTRERFIRELDRDFPKTTPSQPIASAARAEGVLEGLEEAAQLASKSLFGQNASDVIRAEIDRRKAEGEGGQNVALDG